MIREDPLSDLVVPRSACLLRPVAGDEVYGRSSGRRAARNATSGATGRPAWQVRTWHFFHRHTVLSMCALALLAAAADPGMVKGSVPEARRLLRLATTPATAARQLGHAWSRRRRRHQARARFHHYQARLMSA